MITASELQTLLMACYESLENHLMADTHQRFIEQLSTAILQATTDRPLPSYDALKTSPEASEVFKTMIQESGKLLHSKKNELAQVKQSFDSERSKDTPVPEDINALITQLIGVKLHEFEDIFAMEDETKIRWDTFKKGFNQNNARAPYESIEHAFLWLYQRCEQNIDKKIFVIINNSPKLRQLARISLAIHSEQCVKELNQSTGPVHIIHIHSSYSPPRSAEYLHTYDSDDEPELADSFDKTNHGLGSGVYGLAALSSEELDARTFERNSKFKIVKIDKPLRLIDNATTHESDNLTVVSKTLQRTCNHIRKIQTAEDKSRTAKTSAFFSEKENRMNVHDLAGTLCKFQNISLAQDKMYELLLETIQEFFTQAKRTQDNNIVAMPINYLIKKLGFTGIVSTINDAFNRGLIAIELETDIEGLVCIPVKPTGSVCQSPRQSIQSRPWGSQLTPTSIRSNDDSPSPMFFTRAGRSSSCPNEIFGSKNTCTPFF